MAVPAALLCILFTAVGLTRGADWLVAPVPGLPGLPLGNLATWLSLVALAWLALLAVGSGRGRPWSRVLLAAALAWLPVSALIAGNGSLSFRTETGWFAWIGYTVALVCSSVFALTIGLIRRLASRRQKPGA